MKALLLKWDLSNNDPAIFEQLRAYIARESWERYANREGLRQKVWFSNPKERVFGGFYLWDTHEAMEEEIASMYRVEAMTGVPPAITRLDVEAIQEGNYVSGDLCSMGAAWIDHPFPAS